VRPRLAGRGEGHMPCVTGSDVPLEPLFAAGEIELEAVFHLPLVLERDGQLLPGRRCDEARGELVLLRGHLERASPPGGPGGPGRLRSPAAARDDGERPEGERQGQGSIELLHHNRPPWNKCRRALQNLYLLPPWALRAHGRRDGPVRPCYESA